jgi:hypothetical protein
LTMSSIILGLPSVAVRRRVSLWRRGSPSVIPPSMVGIDDWRSGEANDTERTFAILSDARRVLCCPTASQLPRKLGFSGPPQINLLRARSGYGPARRCSSRRPLAPPGECLPAVRFSTQSRNPCGKSTLRSAPQPSPAHGRWWRSEDICRWRPGCDGRVAAELSGHRCRIRLNARQMHVGYVAGDIGATI